MCRDDRFLKPLKLDRHRAECELVIQLSYKSYTLALAS